jgi:SAM-dependent methyltransferase
MGALTAGFYRAGGWGDQPDEIFDIVTDTVEFYGLQRGMTVLDVGCGDGSFTAEFQRQGLVATGVDSDRDAVAVACERNPGPVYRVADIELPLVTDERWDILFCRGLPHAGRPRDGRSDVVMRHLHRIINWDGLLLFERNTDGTGVRGPSRYFPDVTMSNPTAYDLQAIVGECFHVETVRVLPGRIQLGARP